MEQLFGLVNTLLQDHPDTCKRHLCVRTYKVEFLLCMSSFLYIFGTWDSSSTWPFAECSNHARYFTTGRSIHTQCWSAGVGWWNHTSWGLSSWQVCFLRNFKRYYVGYFKVFHCQVVHYWQKHTFASAVHGLEVPIIGMAAMIGFSCNVGNTCRL